MDIEKSNLNKEPDEKDYKFLYKRVMQMKMDELFSEPYDGDMDDTE